MNASFGNAPELIIAIVAVNDRWTRSCGRHLPGRTTSLGGAILLAAYAALVVFFFLAGDR